MTPPTLTPLQRAFVALEETRARLARAEGAAREPIAIVGMGCRLPGADNPQAFWRLLKEGREAIVPLPSDRWDTTALYDPDPEVPGRIATSAGGFLRDVRGFDPAFFGITRREAEGMDPQQRLFLEVAWESLENAGYPPDRQGRTSTGVYVGITGNDYATMQMKTGDEVLLDGHFASGIAHSVVSGRLSYLLGLEGPSLSIDTACSSSLVAVHLACQALRAGDCRMALAGGVNLILSPDIFIALSRARMLAPDGRCKTFDADADGFARGEGCGVVVLKRLQDAVEDGDRVLAIIRGSAVNQDGASSGLTAPSGPAQRAVIREALKRAGVEPKQVSYIEAHGTGTQLGDPLELRSLAEVFGPDRDGAERLAIGSVKTNIGHVEAAAGVAGLIKVVLSLQHKEIPAHLNYTKPTPHIDWEAAPFRVHSKAESWLPAGGRRVAGVSSFGFSGTNAHIVLEEAPARAQTGVVAGEAGPYLLVLAANDEHALAELAQRYADALNELTDADLTDFCFSASTSRASAPYRATALANSTDELRRQLRALANGETTSGVRMAKVERRDPPRIAFLFTGQGAQYAGMAALLDKTQPVFRAALDRCAVILDARLERPLRDVLYPAPGVSSPINETIYTQPALFSLEYALTELWRHWGVSADMVMGHSVGEYVAACVSGVLSLEDALTLVAERGRLMQSLPAGGAMAAIFAAESVVADALAAHAGQVSIAGLNGPEQTVISGAASEVQALCDAFSVGGIRCDRLPVSHAFHSPLVDPVLDAFEGAAASVKFNAPSIRLISNLTGAVADPREVVRPAYWRRHVREAVRFVDGALTLAALDPQVCVEMGPQPVLLSFVHDALRERAAKITMVPTLRRSQPDTKQLAEALASLFLAGVEIDWRAVWSAAPRQLRDLPTYPFQRQSCWFASRATKPIAYGRDTGHPLLGARLRSAAADLISFENCLNSESFPYLRDHNVNGRVILPGVAFFEMGVAAGDSVFGKRLALQDVVLAEPLVFDGDESRVIQVLVRREEGGGSLEILSSDANDADGVWRRHVQARFGEASANAPVIAKEAIEVRCNETISSNEHYASLVARGLDFGPSLRGLGGIKRRDTEAFGEVVLPADAGAGSYLIHPALFDASLQVVSAALPSSLGVNGAYLPLAVDEIEVLRTPSGAVLSHVSVEAATSAGSLRGDVLIFDRAGPVARLKGIVFRRAQPAQHVEDPNTYHTVWEPRAVAASPWTPEVAQLANRVVPKIDALFEQHEIAGYNLGFQALEPWCAAWIIRALNELGWRPTIGERFDTPSLANVLGIASRYEGLLDRFFQILAEERFLARIDGGWTVVQPLSADDPAKATSRLLKDHPSSRARISLAANCGADLAPILRGDLNPLERLFPNGSADLAEQLYRDAPEAKAFNQLVRETVREISANLPQSRQMRVLEVGGGTGGTTAWVAPVLGNNASYLFTDIGSSMVARARETFAVHAFMDFKVFDLERDSAEQGIGGGYDIILASNVIHATADLATTLTRLRDLLSPGGIILMLEVAGDERWIDVTFALTDGWWRFTDRDVRQASPLLSRQAWSTLLDKLGFESQILNPPDPRTREAVIAARKPASANVLARGAWAIVPDALGVADAVAAKLKAAGCSVHTISDINAATQLPENLVGIIHLRALDIPRSNDTVIGNAVLQQERSLGSLLELVKAVGRTSFTGVMPRLWVSGRGGQSVHDLSSTDPAQATVWGMTKSIALEHPELRASVIDLDPVVTPEANAACILNCIVASDAEDQIAIRSGGQFVPRVARGAGGTVQEPVRLEAGDSGVIDDLRLVPVARRAPGPGEVEIRVVAGGINFRDVMNAVAMRSDVEPLGGECAGRVVAVGEGVSNLASGDHVVGLAEASFATYATTSAALLGKIPEGTSFAEAATLPFCFMTAHHALNVLGRLTANDTVLIHAGTGGVGLAAIQIAQEVGARIIATAGNPEKRAYLKSLGVDFVFKSRDLAFADQVLALTGGKGVDIVLNSLAGEFIAESVRCLSAQGRFLEIGKRDIWSQQQFKALRPGGDYHAIDLAAMRVGDPVATEQLFAFVLDKVGKGHWKPLRVNAFRLERSDEAFRFMAQARHIGKVVLVSDDLEAAAMDSVGAEGAYLVTGGLGGLGLLTAQHLARQGAKHLVLAGRSVPSQDALGAIEAMRADGVSVEVVQTDVSDSADVAKLLTVVNAGKAPLRGVVHSAGALHDGALVQQSWDRFAEPLGAKVNGAWALHVLTRHARLDFFIMYSSIASVLGAAGQANHAAANAFMDALAFHRRGEGLPALSISWGAWKDVGAAADRNMDDRVSARGIGMIAPAQGIHALDRLSEKAAPHTTFFPVQWDVFLKERPSASPFLSRLSVSSKTVRTERKAAASASMPAAITAELQAAPPAKRHDLLVNFVAEHVGRVTGAPDWRAIDLAQPLNELGLDSLMSVDLRNRLGAGLGIGRSLPATLVFDHPTIDALAIYLARTIFGAEEQVVSAETNLAQDLIDDLSEEEIERLFAKRMGAS